jgi:hypothetical protein
LEVFKTDLEEHILPLLSKINSISMLNKIKNKDSEMNGATWYLPEFVK